MKLGHSGRKDVLTLHDSTTVGWLGAVLVFIALAIVGLTSDDPATVRGVYLVMEPTAWFALVPLSLASLLSGIVQSLATSWGLLRHYWVVFKLAITVLCTLVLLNYMKTFDYMSDAAANPTSTIAQVRDFSPALHSGLALLALLAATVLAVYKPKGLTPYGLRKQATRSNR
jgi:hypothetical protein